MGAEPRLTSQTLLVLSELMVDRRRELSGADIAARSKLKSGTLYPILARLEEAGWLTSHWEAGDPAALGRPRRRYYRVTAEGAKNARSAARDFAPSLQRLAWG